MWKFPLYKIDAPIDWAALEAKFDWFREMKDVPQDPIWHAEGNVFIHTKMVVEALVNLPEFKALSPQNKHLLFAAAMLHDVEKRSTTRTEMLGGIERIISPSHARKGEYTARTFLYKKHPTPFAIREEIAKLVRYHGLPIWAIDKPDPRKSVIEASLSVNTQLLYLLSKADVLGRINEQEEERLLRVELFKSLCEEHQCFGKAREFASNAGRYTFLNCSEIAPDYKPYEKFKFEAFVICALPGTGKDTYIKKHFDLPILSLDDIRRKHKIDPANKRKMGQLIQLAKEEAKVLMRAKKSFVYNATNITSDIRQKWISLFTEYGGKINIIYLEVPYKKLLQQNHNRTHKVPELVLEKYITKLEMPTFKEAHEMEFVVKE